MSSASLPASTFVTLGFGCLAVIVASGFVMLYANAVARLGGNRTIARMAIRTGLLGWMMLWAVLAESGKLSDFARKPPPLLMALVMFVVAGLVLGFSEIGTKFMRGTPLWSLVATQGFRLPLELLVYVASREGTIPSELSFAGYNFDILTGISALVLARYLREREPNFKLVLAWNVLGSLLLVLDIVLLIASSPLVRAFGQSASHVSNYITLFPFIWQGTVLIAAGVFGHVVIFRLLHAWRRSSWSPTSSHPSSSPQPSSS